MLHSVISSTAIFACSDIELTLAYYKEVLGFESTWAWGNPPTFGSATVGGVSIHFNLQPELAKKVEGHQHWVKVEEVDELYQLHRSRDATIVSEIEDKPWGAREYIVQDLNGYHLRFAGTPATHARPSSAFPEGVKIERRKPTAAEYSLVADAAFGYKQPVPEVLGSTWSGVVALSPDGEVIGVLRIMWDAPGWFSIWDVAVVPKWQARRIGSAMMREAIEAIREASPNANIHLFTYQYGFYERLGFTKETASMRRL